MTNWGKSMANETTNSQMECFSGNQAENLKKGNFFKRLYLKLHRGGVALNEKNIREAVLASLRERSESKPNHKLNWIDLGCDDGSWTQKILNGEKIKSPVATYGFEKVALQASKARALGIQVTEGDLSLKLPYPDDFFDVVHSNQVIEHIPSIDHFVGEIFRILAPGGFFVVSSENASAWHNIGASILGWQIFSLTNVSAKAGAVGNPLAAHRGSQAFSETWTHKTIFNYLGFKEIFEVHGFKKVKVFGAGYYPLPPILGKWDHRHAHFLTACGQKPT